MLIPSNFAANSLGIYLAFWAIRRKGDLDLPQNPTDKAVRWGVCIAGLLAATRLPWPNARVACLFVYLAFLVWPNFAVHLCNLFRKSYWEQRKRERQESGSYWPKPPEERF